MQSKLVAVSTGLEELVKLMRAGQQGHDSLVRSATFSPNGELIVTASDDAKMWKSSDGSLVETLQGHSRSVYSATFSPHGELIVTASYDETAKIWKSSDGSLVETLQGHSKEVNSATFSPDGELIVTASDDKTAKIWKSSDGSLVETLQGHRDRVSSATFSPNGELIVTASHDQTVKIWKSSDGSLVKTLQGHSKEVTLATFSPNGELILTASDDYATIRQSSDGSHIRILHGHSRAVTSATFSPNGELIVTASYGKSAKIWRSSDGRLVKTLQGHSGRVYSATFSPNGELIVTASYDKTAKIWKSSDGSLVETLQGHSDRVYSATFSPNGKLIVTASHDNAAFLWECDIDSNSYRMLCKLKSLELFERMTPWASLVSLIFQVTSFNFSKSVPWNTTAIAPVQFATYFAMVHIEDFPGSHALYVSAKVLMVLFLAFDFVCAAFFGKLLITSLICTQATQKKLRGYFILGMSQLLFIPALQILFEAVWCNSDAWQTSKEFKGSIKLLMGECLSPRYWICTVIIALVLPFFVWAQLPFILAGGDAQTVTPMVMRRPREWVKANKISQRKKIPNFFSQEAFFTDEDQCLNPALCGAASELCLKLVVSVASTTAFGPVSILVSLAAVSLRWLVQWALPLYRNRAANILMHGSKALMFWSYLAGWWVWNSFKDVQVADRPAYPAIVFYAVSFSIFCLTFTGMVMACIPREMGLNEPLLQ